MEGTQAPEQIIINGQEYTPEDATHLIELGNKWKETESKLNTSLDKVYPEYTKTTQRNKDLEAELAAERTKREALEKSQKQELPQDIVAIRKNAREVGLADVDYLKEQGYMTKTEMDEYFNQKQNQQKLVENILTKASGLEKTIDGSDGRVPFDSDAVLAYASAYNIDDLEEAYDKMNNKGNAKWKEAQLEKEQRPGLTTLGKGGKKEPERVKITDDNFKEHWNEMFGGGEE